MYSEQEQANNEHTEALQPRLSLGTPPSSSLTTTTIIDKTAIYDIDTTRNKTHDIRNGSQNTTATITTASINTTSSIITSCNETGNDVHKTTNTMAVNSINGLLDDSGYLTAGFSLASAGFQASAGGVVNSVESLGLKRKRDWMNSLTQPESDIMGVDGGGYKSKTSSLLTSVKITNGPLSFPAGWEQYLDLQTGETYYVNWNTRTKHCRVQCPEVQRCLAGAQHQQQQQPQQLGKPNNNNKESVESWLSKMTATTSALVNNKPLFGSKPPLPPTHPLKSMKLLQPPSLDISIRHKPKTRPTTINPSHTLSSYLLDANDALPSNIHAMHIPNFMPTPIHDYTCNFSSSIDAMHSPNLSSKPHDNIIYESLEVPSTSGDPLAFVCSNCNMLVMISSLTMMHCPNCNHLIKRWSEDATCSPCDMSSSTLSLLEASTKIARSS